MEFIEIQAGSGKGLFDEVRRSLYNFPVPEDRIAGNFISGFVLTHEGIPKGRFALYDNPDITWQNQKCLSIGNYECVDSELYAKALLDKARELATCAGAHFLIGPMNGSTWENYRFAEQLNDNRFFLEPVNHAYYNQQFTGSGFHKIAGYFSAIDRSMQYRWSGIENREAGLIASGVQFRNIDMHHYENELGLIYELSIQSFRDAFLFSPISRENFIQKYLPLAPVIQSDHVILAENSTGLLGYIFCVDDTFSKNEKRLIIKTIARAPGAENAGLGEVLGKKIYDYALRSGYPAIIHALMYEQGNSVSHSAPRTGEILNTYSLYAYPLNL